MSLPFEADSVTGLGCIEKVASDLIDSRRQVRPVTANTGTVNERGERFREPTHPTPGECMTGVAQLTNSTRQWLIAGLVIVAIIVGLQDTFATMLRHWVEIDTYNHCLLIAPISAWLIWQRRRVLATIQPKVSLIGLMVIVVTIAIWSIGAIASLTIVQDISAVVLIPLTVWAILGTSMVRPILFPLGYLLFLVPFGGFLIPLLMDFTADTTVMAVRASGVPIYHDGLFFEIPNGSFKIIEACSGIRMLTAGVAVGVLFAYLNFRSMRRRAVFLVGAIALMLIANWIRAYIVVMVAHFSGMELVADHVWLGYVIFAVVIIIMLWIGSRYSDIDEIIDTGLGDETDSKSADVPGILGGHLIVAGMIVGVVALAPPLVSAVTQRAAQVTDVPVASLSASSGVWSGPMPAPDDWSPVFYGDFLTQSGHYVGPTAAVDVYILSYRQFTAQSELINENNRLFDPQRWILIGRTNGSADSFDYVETEIRAPNGHSRLVRHWYVIDGRAVRNRVVIKLIELRNTLIGRPTAAGLIAVSTRFDGDVVQASRILDGFMTEFTR